MIKKENRLKLSRHFKRAFEKGISWRGDLFYIKAYKRMERGGPEPAKLAVVVSRKVAPSAVQRNLYRRRFKAAFYPVLNSLRGWDVVVMPKKGAETIEFARLEGEIKKCLEFLQSK